MRTSKVLVLCLVSLVLASLVGCFRGSPPAAPVDPDAELEAQAVASNDIRLWHKNNEARLTWTGIGGTNGDEKVNPANGLEEIAFPVLDVTAVGGVLEVGGGEGYGIKSSLDGNGNNRKTINGPELLYLTLPSGTEAAFISAGLTFRIAKDSTQDVILTAKRNGDVVDSQTLSVSGQPGKSTSDRINVTLAAPADQLSFSVPGGSKVGLRDSTFTTQVSDPANPGPVTGDGRGEL